jgi:hypothetical protein
MREAIASAGGTEVGTEGDSFFAFQRAWEAGLAMSVDEAVADALAGPEEAG